MLRTSRLILSIPTYAVLALVAAVGSLPVFVLSQPRLADERSCV